MTDSLSPMRDELHLIIYVDPLAGDLAGLGAVKRVPLAGTLGGVRFLPCFAPIDWSRRPAHQSAHPGVRARDSADRLRRPVGHVERHRRYEIEVDGATAIPRRDCAGDARSRTGPRWRAGADVGRAEVDPRSPCGGVLSRGAPPWRRRGTDPPTPRDQARQRVHRRRQHPELGPPRAAWVEPDRAPLLARSWSPRPRRRADQRWRGSLVG